MGTGNHLTGTCDVAVLHDGGRDPGSSNDIEPRPHRSSQDNCFVGYLSVQ
jgi:hypothetical protein